MVGPVRTYPATFTAHDHRLVLTEACDVGSDDRAPSPFQGPFLCRLDPLGQDQRVIRNVQNWRLLFTSFLAGLAVMVVLNNVAEEIGWTGFVFARLHDRHGPLRAALATTVFFWLYHVPSFYVETRSWVTTAVGWLYNGAGSSVLIAGLFHSMHNAMVNPTGLVAVLGPPQGEILVIVAGLAVLAGGIIAVDTRGRLGLKRASPPDTDPVSEG